MFPYGTSAHLQQLCDHILSVKARDCPFHIQDSLTEDPGSGWKSALSVSLALVLSSLPRQFMKSPGSLSPRLGEQDPQTLRGK